MRPISDYDVQTKMDRIAARRGLITLLRRALASEDGELLKAVKALEVVFGDVTPDELKQSRATLQDR